MVHGQGCQCRLDDLAELEAQALARTPWPKTPSMTRQHFDYVARILAEMSEDCAVQQRIVKHFAYHLADTNGRLTPTGLSTPATPDRRGTNNAR